MHQPLMVEAELVARQQGRLASLQVMHRAGQQIQPADQFLVAQEQGIGRCRMMERRPDRLGIAHVDSHASAMVPQFL